MSICNFTVHTAVTASPFRCNLFKYINCVSSVDQGLPFIDYENFSKSLSLSDLSILHSFNQLCIHSSSTDWAPTMYLVFWLYHLICICFFTRRGPSIVSAMNSSASIWGHPCSQRALGDLGKSCLRKIKLIRDLKVTG